MCLFSVSTAWHLSISAMHDRTREAANQLCLRHVACRPMHGDCSRGKGGWGGCYLTAGWEIEPGREGGVGPGQEVMKRYLCGKENEQLESCGLDGDSPRPALREGHDGYDSARREIGFYLFVSPRLHPLNFMRGRLCFFHWLPSLFCFSLTCLNGLWQC